MKKSTVILIVLIIAFVSLAITSMSQKSLTCDESAHHIPTGYVFLKTGDFVYATDSPPLARYLVGLPMLFMDIDLPEDRSFWAREDRAEFSREFLYELNRKHVSNIIFWGRIPIVILGVFGGIFIFIWVRKKYDDVTACITALFYFLSPNILAHARLATTDMVATVFIVCSVLLFWDMLTRPGIKTVFWAGVFFALAMLSKYSALLLSPFYVIVAIGFFVKSRFAKDEEKKTRC